jgi:hypothetical protein
VRPVDHEVPSRSLNRKAVASKRPRRRQEVGLAAPPFPIGSSAAAPRPASPRSPRPPAGGFPMSGARRFGGARARHIRSARTEGPVLPRPQPNRGGSSVNTARPPRRARRQRPRAPRRRRGLAPRRPVAVSRAGPGAAHCPSAPTYDPAVTSPSAAIPGWPNAWRRPRSCSTT